MHRAGVGGGDRLRRGLHRVIWSPEHSGSFLKEGSPELTLEECVVRGELRAGEDSCVSLELCPS